MATYQSLYRRYRSQRFDEVLGQDHITKALRNAVREGRVGHAYLFSGPRGTGKTSTARILAKVLNCADPQDGEPCGTCGNCVAVAEGRVTDWLLEQDAASKSKVDDMRDLLERVPLGTSGNKKVIILDEVHMLSQGAENALLKTLEEPPDHVVFVLATTDPQKVRPTIRSRTQHFDFHLLPTDVLTDHVRRIIDDAGLGLGDDAVEHVVRVGGGSARDTLSALDQVAALGEVVSDTEPVDAVIDALCNRDAGAALVAVADALAVGRDPRTLGEEVIAGLRNAFLAVMGVADTHLAPADRDRAASVGERLGAAGLTRALEVLGEALTELARKPDPRIVVEVALVRLTRADTDRSVDAILERLDRLEQGVSLAPPQGGSAGGPAQGSAPAGAGGGAADAGQPGSPSVDSARAVLAARRGTKKADRPAGGSASGTGQSGDEAGAASEAGAGDAGAPGGKRGARSSGSEGSPTLGPVAEAAASDEAGPGDANASGGSRRARSSVRKGSPTLGSVARGAAGGSAPGADEDAGPAVPSEDVAPAGEAGPPDVGTTTAGPAPRDVEGAWAAVLGGLPISVRSKWRAGRWDGADGGALRFAVDNEWHQKVCEDTRRDVEQALVGHFGQPVTVAVVVEGAGGRGGGAGPAPASGRAGGSAGGSGGASAPRSSRGADTGPGPSVDADDEHIDPSELRDAGDVTVGGVDLLMREFGGELVEGEQR